MHHDTPTDATLTAPLPHPVYPDATYLLTQFGRGPAVRAWSFDGWQSESRSWSEGCYIHAGLSRSGPWSISGPGAAEWLQSKLINSFARFPVGTMKHGVMCTPEGLISSHGIIQRKGPDEFESFAGGPPGFVAPSDVPDSVRLVRRDDYLFQIAGPTSRDVLERVTGQRLDDLGFLRFRPATAAGQATEIGRIGMTGGLAYELHGPMSDAAVVYDAVVAAGSDLGIQRLGWGTYLVNHVEGGFPQHSWTFMGAADPSVDPMAAMFTRIRSGSVDASDLRARQRTPVEVRWHNMARFDHDFPGAEALAAEIADPKRTTVTLRWNIDDVLDIHASLYRDERFTPLDYPYSPQRWPSAHADHIVVDGVPAGWSSGTVYSTRFRQQLSMGCIDVAAAEIGREVIVKWGTHGTLLKDVRATVEAFPYLQAGRNSDT